MASSSDAQPPPMAPEHVQALHQLLESNRALEQRAAELCGGSTDLARAWRAWSTLAKLRRQLQMLGRQMEVWREQQLAKERWLRDAQEVLAQLRAEGQSKLEAEAREALRKEQPAKARHMSWGGELADTARSPPRS